MLTHRLHPSRDAGFGLIELIIGMVLLMLVMAMITRGFMSGWTASSQVTANGSAQAGSNALLTNLGSDLRQAVAPGRVATSVTKDELRKEIRAVSSTKYADVLVATDKRLVVWTDAIADGGAERECVEYVEDATGLYRKVYAGGGACPASGTPLDEQRLLKPKSASMTAPRFTYVVEFNPGIFGSNGLKQQDIDLCQTVRGVTGPPPGLPSDAFEDAIIAVQINGTAHERGGGVAFDPNSSYSLQSRRSETYRGALGCAY